MPKEEFQRGSCEDGAKQPRLTFMRTCPKCLEPYMHEPPENEEIRKRNDAKMKTWTADMAAAKAEAKAKRTPAKTPTKPKLEDELLVCKAYTMRHSNSVGGYKCNDCVDRSCSLCSNMCMFVCNKKYVCEYVVSSCPIDHHLTLLLSLSLCHLLGSIKKKRNSLKS